MADVMKEGCEDKLIICSRILGECCGLQHMLQLADGFSDVIIVSFLSIVRENILECGHEASDGGNIVLLTFWGGTSERVSRKSHDFGIDCSSRDKNARDRIAFRILYLRGVNSRWQDRSKVQRYNSFRFKSFWGSYLFWEAFGPQ